MKLRLTFFFCALFLFSAAQSWGQTSTIAVTGIWDMTTGSTSFGINNTLQLYVQVLPYDATNKNIIWNSDNESVATVSALGLVFGKEIGTATITATTEDGGFTKSWAVTVLPDFVVDNGVLVDYLGPDVDVVVPDDLGITEIGEGLFYYNASKNTNYHIHSIVIPEGVTKIGDNAFVENSLTSITLPNSLKTIGYRVFWGCPNLASVTFPDSLESIGDIAFYQCSSLSSVAFPNSLKTVGGAAFMYIDSLTSVSISSSVISIGNGAFANSGPKFSTITVDPDNPNYSVKENVLYNQDQTLLHTYPAGKSDTAFSIPNSVVSIGSYAFSCSGANLKYITIPNSVLSIGDGALTCPSLTGITVNWTTPLTISSNVFSYINTATLLVSTDTLYVPSGTKALYKADPVWGTFGTIDDGTPDYTLSVSSDSLHFAASGEQKTVAITSDTEWAISSNVSWLTVSPVAGANNDTITVTAAANTGTSPRSATLTVSGTGVTEQTISITQDGIPPIPVTSVVLNYSAAELTAGETLQLVATIFPGNATDKTVFWSSSDTTVARVDTTGKVSALAAGSATVTVTTADSIRSASCLITVKDISVEVPDTITVAQNGKGTIALSLTIPSDATLTGSFEIQFPDGMTPDIALCVLAPELAGSFTLSFTSEGNNTWLITISAKGLKSSQAIEYRKIMDIAYQVADTVATGSYEATIRNLDFALDNGTSIQEDSLTIPITVSGSMTAIDNVRNTSFYASVINQKMKVVSPNNELITIYSVKGDVLYSTMKNSGPIEIPVSSLHGSVVIIKGSVSGTIKVVR